MQKALLVMGLAVMAFGLRSSRVTPIRKLGAVVILAASFLAAALLFRTWWAGLLGLLPWVLLPWVELLTRTRRMRFHLRNCLRHNGCPRLDYFPYASDAVMAIHQHGFQHACDCDWEWSGMRQYFKLYWHPEKRLEIAVCLCEQYDVTFSFLTITSRDYLGRTFKTTNFPFSRTLKCPRNVIFNHMPCECNKLHKLLEKHSLLLGGHGVDHGTLLSTEPSTMAATLEKEARELLSHNLKLGIIRHTACGTDHCCYSLRGLLFLWGQYLKDMIRLC